MQPGEPTFDRRGEAGPFDIIGDVHGCTDELEELLTTLGYGVHWQGETAPPRVSAPGKRRAIFVGDLVDRGPRSRDAVRLVMAMCETGVALCVPGNHDNKFRRWLDGHNVVVQHGLAKTVADYAHAPAAERARVSTFLRALPHYLWLDGGQLVVAHAGIEAGMIGQMSHKIEAFCLYGDTGRGETPDGYPVRYNWAARYDGAPLVVYGHICVETPTWMRGTVCIDTGCCFGGALTALRYPERETISVPARATYVPRAMKFGLPPTR